MFRSRKSRRPPNSTSRQQQGGRFRRLRVELMEGRLMLAASPLDASQGVSDTTQPVWMLGHIGSTASYVVKVQSQPTEGGFVGYHYTDSSSDTTISLNGSNFLDTSASWDAPYALGTSNAVSGETVVFGTTPRVSSIGDTGLTGAVIVTDLDSRDMGSALSPFDIKPVVIGPGSNQPGPTSPGRNEGGSIPIHAIFADFRQDGHLASGVKSVSSLLTEASIDLQASARVSSASNDAVAGEWARATVFEIAGGEPGELTSPGERSTKASSNGDAILQTDPLSTIETSHQSTGRRAAKASAADTTDGQVGQQQPQSQGLIAIDNAAANQTKPTQDVSADALATSSALVDSMQLAGTNPAGAPNPEIAAVEAVFRRLGEDKTAVVESNLHGKSWLHSISTSPLLIALALERIAALNSRRARHEARVSPVKVSH